MVVLPIQEKVVASLRHVFTNRYFMNHVTGNAGKKPKSVIKPYDIAKNLFKTRKNT